MSTVSDPCPSLCRLVEWVDTFDVGGDGSGGKQALSAFFVEGAQQDLARFLGDYFWLPVERANTIFIYAYAALFGIPPFVQEALARMPDRFSAKRLPLTIRTTSSFILDAFGYDRRVGRERDVTYWPAPAIRTSHAARQGKVRISNPAMAYFGYQLIRAAEWLSDRQKDAGFTAHCEGQYGYVGEFFRTAGYPFPRDRERASEFSCQVDRHLARGTYAHLWNHLAEVGQTLDVALNSVDLTRFLPAQTSALFRNATESRHNHWVGSFQRP